MAYKTIIVEIEDHVALIRLNRPDALNALNTELLGELSEALSETEANEKVRCVVLTGSEKAFAAGFISMAGNLALLLNGIGLAVTFTILLVTANTMSMAVRERRTEIAVLKTLGPIAEPFAVFQQAKAGGFSLIMSCV